MASLAIPKSAKNSRTSIPTGNLFLVVGTPSSIPPSFFPDLALKLCCLVPWWYFLRRTKQPYFQLPIAPQRLCQLRLFCLNHSSLRVCQLQILWDKKLAAGMWNPVAKAPLPKVWWRNTNFSTCFPAFLSCSYSPISKFFIPSMEITFILTELEGLKKSQEVWFGKGKFLLEIFSRSV